MKKNKLTLVTKILALIAICLIGFAGIYLPWKKPFEMNNLVKDFKLSKDLSGYREITFKLSDDSKINKEENLTSENYEKTKRIIEKRLNEMGVQDYNLSLDKQTGMMYLQIPEDSLADKVVSNILETGTIELKDSEDENKVLISQDKLEKATYFYHTGTTGTVVYLELQFNKEGTEILKDISENEYKTIKETENETENEDESETKKDEEKEETNQKKVALYMSGNSTTTTSFDDVIKDGKIDLSMSQALSKTSEVNESLKSAKIVAMLINNSLPLKYEVGENKYVETDIAPSRIRNAMIAVGVVLVALLVYMIVKHKKRGLLAAIAYISFIAVYLLILRVFNVLIDLSGILGGILVALLNYWTVMSLLKVDGKDNKNYYKEYLNVIMKMLPILAIAIAFVFMPIVGLASIGMVMFWGISLILLHNVAITKHIVD